ALVQIETIDCKCRNDLEAAEVDNVTAGDTSCAQIGFPLRRCDAHRTGGNENAAGLHIADRSADLRSEEEIVHAPSRVSLDHIPVAIALGVAGVLFDLLAGKESIADAIPPRVQRTPFSAKRNALTCTVETGIARTIMYVGVEFLRPKPEFGSGVF